MKTPIESFSEQAATLRKRIDRLQTSIHNRGWKVAADAGIPRDGCCLHNASIDTELTGWCKGNPERLHAAKLATRIVSDFSASRLGDLLYRKLWNRVVAPHGYCAYSEASMQPRPTISPVLFARR